MRMMQARLKPKPDGEPIAFPKTVVVDARDSMAF